MPHWSLLALGTACCTTAADLALRALLRQGFTVRLGLGLSCCLTALLALPLLLAVALLALVGTSLQMEALRSTAVVHVVAIKRLSTLLGSLAGLLWLGEPGGALRLPAAALMVSGALIVLLAARA